MEQIEQSDIAKDTHCVTTEWKGKMHFESDVNEHIVHMDKLPVHGGDGMGPRPKQLLLSAIAGCTGMEIISIADKMRLKIQRLDITVTGELTTEIPKTYTKIAILFRIACNYTDREKVGKAVHLAADKYCGVVAMVRKFAKVEIEISYLNAENA
jgi:putative redox protein